MFRVPGRPSVDLAFRLWQPAGSAGSTSSSASRLADLSSRRAGPARFRISDQAAARASVSPSSRLCYPEIMGPTRWLLVAVNRAVTISLAVAWAMISPDIFLDQRAGDICARDYIPPVSRDAGSVSLIARSIDPVIRSA